MKLTKTLIAMLGAVALAGVCGANAAQINGTVGFTSAPNSAAGSASLHNGVTTIHFNNPMLVNFGSGDYTGTESSATTFTDFSFSGSGTSATLTGGAVVPEWTFMSGGKTYSFDLLNLMSGTFTPNVGHGLNALSLQGEGVAHITGFQDTMATFSLQGTGTRFTFTILQSSNTALPSNGVPEGGSALSLLGLGLVAVEALRRKLATA